MTTASDSWYRVAALRPRLRNHAQVHRHVYRGEVWYVLQNHSTGRFHRFSVVANRILGFMDGQRSVQEVWDLASIALGEEMPSQAEVIKLLSDLYRADVLQSDAAPDFGELQARRRRHENLRWRQRFANPLSLRFPLVDPDAWLCAALPRLGWLFGRWGGLLWLATVVAAAALAGQYWQELTSNIVDRVLSADNLLLTIVVFPLIKLLHELGHALVTRQRGGEVHEMGIMLLVLMPIPYVDASAATAFADKRCRMLVGAAGMMVDLFVAALAVFAWIALEPGTARAVAYNVILVAGISTLLINGNPLLRYDGYYILADWLEMPNFAKRASEQIAYFVNHHVFGLAEIPSPARDRREGAILVSYGLASFIFRMVMMVAIIEGVASRFFLFGVVLAIAAAVGLLVMPLIKVASYLFYGQALARKRRRALSASGAFLVLALVVLLVLPWPASTLTEGVVWADEQSVLRPAVDGFIVELLADPGARVKAGQPLIRLADPGLTAHLASTTAQVIELDARYDLARTDTRAAAEMVNDLRPEVLAAQAEARRSVNDLVIASHCDGVFVMPDATDAIGRFVPRGEVLAYVTGCSANVRVVVPEAEGDLVSRRTSEVEIRATHRLATLVVARMEREVPAATHELPSAILGAQGGGKIVLDPGHREANQSLQKFFLVDLRLPAGESLPYVGERIHVRFALQPEPLAWQWYRSVRRAFLRSFNV